jgi:hypothetical protein
MLPTSTILSSWTPSSYLNDYSHSTLGPLRPRSYVSNPKHGNGACDRPPGAAVTFPVEQESGYAFGLV